MFSHLDCSTLDRGKTEMRETTKASLTELSNMNKGNP
jgi:hypothetical protein